MTLDGGFLVPDSDVTAWREGNTISNVVWRKKFLTRSIFVAQIMCDFRFGIYDIRLT